MTCKHTCAASFSRVLAPISFEPVIDSRNVNTGPKNRRWYHCRFRCGARADFVPPASDQRNHQQSGFLFEQWGLLHARSWTAMPSGPFRLGRLSRKPQGLRLVLRTGWRIRLLAARQPVHVVVRLQSARTQYCLGDKGFADRSVDEQRRRQLQVRRPRRVRLFERGWGAISAGRQLRQSGHSTRASAVPSTL